MNYFNKEDWGFIFASLNNDTHGYVSKSLAKELDSTLQHIADPSIQNELLNIGKHIMRRNHYLEKEWDVVIQNLHNLLTVEEGSNLIYNFFTNHMDEKCSKNVIEYTIKKYPESKEIFFNEQNYNLQNHTFILDLYFKDKMKHKDFEELPEWMMKSGSYTFEEAIKKKTFSSKTFFSYLENIKDRESVLEFIQNKKSVFNGCKFYHELLEKISPSDEIEIPMLTENSITVERDFNFNISSFLYKNNILKESQINKIYNYLEHRISGVPGTSFASKDNGLIEIKIKTTMRFNDDFLTDDTFQPYTNISFLKTCTKAINKCIDELKIIMEVPEFLNFYNSGDENSLKHISYAELKNIEDGIENYYLKKELLSQKDIIENSLNNTEEEISKEKSDFHIPSTFKM